MLHTNPARPAPSSRARNHVRDHRKLARSNTMRAGGAPRRLRPSDTAPATPEPTQNQRRTLPRAHARTAETPPSKASERDSERARRASMAWRRRTPKRASLGRRPRPRRASTSLRSRARASTSRLPAGALFQALPTSKIAYDGAGARSPRGHVRVRLHARRVGGLLRVRGLRINQPVLASSVER